MRTHELSVQTIGNVSLSFKKNNTPIIPKDLIPSYVSKNNDTFTFQINKIKFFPYMVELKDEVVQDKGNPNNITNKFLGFEDGIQVNKNLYECWTLLQSKSVKLFIFTHCIWFIFSLLLFLYALFPAYEIAESSIKVFMESKSFSIFMIDSSLLFFIYSIVYLYYVCMVMIYLFKNKNGIQKEFNYSTKVKNIMYFLILIFLCLATYDFLVYNLNISDHILSYAIIGSVLFSFVYFFNFLLYRLSLFSKNELLFFTSNERELNGFVLVVQRIIGDQGYKNDK